jgi:hypothetical protein
MENSIHVGKPENTEKEGSFERKPADRGLKVAFRGHLRWFAPAKLTTTKIDNLLERKRLRKRTT